MKTIRIFAFSLLSLAALGNPSIGIPFKLIPPGGQKLVFHLHGSGDQIYTCKSIETSLRWVLKGPDAKLLGQDGKIFGHHFAGPTWQAEDDSRVVGEVAASNPSPDPSAIPWLLLRAKEHEGSGRMSCVLSIQRLSTKGGIAPIGGCDPLHAGMEARVPYEAEYYFYGSAK